MKKLTLLIVAIMAMSTFAIAASGTYDADGPNSYKNGGLSSDYQDAKYYVGIAYGLLDANADAQMDQPEVIRGETELEGNSIMFQLGYQINEYVAVEGRYWLSFGDLDETFTSSTHPQFNYSDSYDSDNEEAAYGFYVKPMYPVTSEFSVYALLGYAKAEDIAADDDGFSWGLGVSYGINNNVSFFVDYTSLYDDDVSDELLGYDIDADITFDSWNFGVAYKF